MGQTQYSSKCPIQICNDRWVLQLQSSVITATSAAALAIPGLAGPGSYWMVNTCFCVALGLALEGVILSFYLSVMSGAASDETLGKLARGKLEVFNIQIWPRIAALMMALPAIFTTYCSLFLLVGTLVMVITDPMATRANGPNPYYYLPLVPIGLGFLCIIITAMLCEAGSYQQAQIRSRNRDKWDLKQKQVLLGLVAISLVPTHASTFQLKAQGVIRPGDRR